MYVQISLYRVTLDSLSYLLSVKYVYVIYDKKVDHRAKAEIKIKIYMKLNIDKDINVMKSYNLKNGFLVIPFI